MDKIDALIALIDNVINEPGWQAVVFTESSDSASSYAGEYSFNTEAATLSIAPIADPETRLIAPGFGDL